VVIGKRLCHSGASEGPEGETRDSSRNYDLSHHELLFTIGRRDTGTGFSLPQEGAQTGF
jgi:hypothetical protein